MRIAASIVLLVFMGCGGSEPPAAQKEALPVVPVQAAVVEPQQPAPDEFAEALAKFIAEARVVARSMDLIPELKDFRDKVKVINDLYARIPEAPDNEPRRWQRKCARQTAITFAVAAVNLDSYYEAASLNATEVADKCFADFKEYAEKQKKNLSEIESAAKENRIPNIELSDVIKNED